MENEKEPTVESWGSITAQDQIYSTENIHW